MALIKVTGYLEVDDTDLDSGPNGPLTEEAFEWLSGVYPIEGKPVPRLVSLEDLTFEADDR